MDFLFSSKTKQELYTALKNERNAFHQSGDGDQLINFVSQIWDLQNMPSEDMRYTHALGDFRQHLVNNNDWEIDYVFLERLDLFGSDEKFASFIETILRPSNRVNEDEITKLVLLINPYIERDNYLLNLTDYDPAGNPVYTIAPKSEVDSLPSGIKVNKIPFYVQKAVHSKSYVLANHSTPKTFPSFVLVLNNNWNDFGVQTEFHLFYYNDQKQGDLIGPVKIISQEPGKIKTQVPDTFTKLADKFCSLGQSSAYYESLKSIFDRDLESILYALRDAAFFSEIKERFEKSNDYKNSLIRYDVPERLARQVKYELFGYDLKNLYRFKYAFHPQYADAPIEVNFDFSADTDVPNRIYAVIGKNGAGKTQLISSLPLNIWRKKNDFFYPKIPLFSKVIAVSYSVFDSFEIPKKTAAFNYVYCGLRNEKREVISERGLVLRFHNSWKKIAEKQRTAQWRSILSNFIAVEILDEFIIPAQQAGDPDYQVSVEGFTPVRQKLSSGQSIVLYIITEIVANINLDSLLLYDEPETHLHPNAITELMNTIYELVNEFQSYCIICTHSPLVIRELLSRNVFVLERTDTSGSIRKIGIESFGENITTLTEEVFGNKSTSKQYKAIIKKLISEGKNFEQILSLLESDNVSLSLNTRIYIKSLLPQQSGL